MSLRAIAGNANPHLGSWFQLARSIAVGQGSPRDALTFASNSRANEDVVTILKAAVHAGTLESSTWAGGALAQYEILAQSFQQSLQSWSAFDQMLPAMARVPLRSKIVIFSTGPVASRVNESDVKPLSEGSFTMSDPIEPWKTSCIIALTNEVLRMDGPGGGQLFSDKLSLAVAEASDTVFLAGLANADQSPTGSAGATADNVLTDLGALLDQLTIGRNSKLFFVALPDDVKKLTLKRTTGGSPLFPGLTVQGGNLTGGITCIPSAQLAAGTALMVDSQGIAAATGSGAEGILLDSSRETSLQFSSTPDSPIAVGTIQRSLWQEGLTAMRAERYFGFSVLRTTAVAELTGVNY